MKHWNGSGLRHDHVEYRQSTAGRWFYFHNKLGWCPVLSKKTGKTLDQMLADSEESATNPKDSLAAKEES